MASAARRARSSAMMRSAWENRRPDSAATRVRAPSVRPCALSGAVMDEHGCDSEVVQRPEQVGVGGAVLEERRGDLRHQLGLPRADRPRRAGRSLRVARTISQGSPHEVGGRAVDVRDADVVHLPVLEQVDAAPVREARNRQADEIVERLREVERLRQHRARLGEERQRLLAATLLGHVEQRGDGGDDASSGVAYGLGADRDHPARAVCASQHELAVGDRLARRAPDRRTPGGVRPPRSSVPRRGSPRRARSRAPPGRTAPRRSGRPAAAAGRAR